MKEYPTQERLKELFNYRDDGQLIWNVRTADRIHVGDVAGHIVKKGYRLIGVDTIVYFAHRLVWIWNYGYKPENDIDHINRDKSDNRIENLRETTRSCNVRNSGNPCTNTSGVKGVCWHKTMEKWHVSICIIGNRRFIGYHNNFHNAVLHRLASEQCLDWEGCDSSSHAYQYAVKHKLINRGE